MPTDPEFKKKVDDLAGKAQDALDRAVEKAGEVAHDKRKDIEDFLDRTGDKIDERTQGKYSDKVEKAKQTLVQGVDRLAERRPDDTPGGPGPS